MQNDAKWCKTLVMIFWPTSHRIVSDMTPDPIQQPPQHRSQHPGSTGKYDVTPCCNNSSTSALTLILDVLHLFNHVQSMQTVIQIKQTHNLHQTSVTLKGVWIHKFQGASQQANPSPQLSIESSRSSWRLGERNAGWNDKNSWKPKNLEIIENLILYIYTYIYIHKKVRAFRMTDWYWCRHVEGMPELASA